MDRRLFMIGASALATTPVWAQSGARTRVFKVIRDSSDIGRHQVTATTQGDDLVVEIEIDLAVRILGFVGYRYEHRNREVWRGGALQSLDTTTNDDGDDFRVSLRRDDDGFQIDATQFSGNAPLDSAPTSYWNYANLSAPRWIDTQGGRVLNISISPSERVNGLERRVVSGDFDLTLFYDDQREWRASAFDGQGEPVTYEEIETGPRFLALL